MKLKWLVPALLLAGAAFGQVTNQTSGPLSGTGGSISTCYPTQTAANACYVFTNFYGAKSTIFEEIPAGSPSAVSVSIYGCMRGGTCDSVADNNTSTSKANRSVSFSAPYDVWVAVVITLTGGTSPTMTINLKGSTASSGAVGGGVTSFNTRTGVVVPASGDYTVSQVTGAAPLASPTFTGVPAAPTATVGTNTTQVATTAFVLANAGAVSSVFGRTGAVVAASADYTCAQVTNCPTLSGTGLVRQSGAATELSGDVTTSGSNAATVKGLNGTLLSGLATGLLKNTTTTGAPSIAVANTDYAAANAASTVNGTSCAVNGSCTVTAAPSGSAGGDLSGTYPNPTVAKIGTVSLPTLTAATGILYDTAGVLSLAATLPTAAEPAFTGDVTKSAASLATTVTAINGTALSSLATGILKNTTTTGVPSIAVAGTDYVAPGGALGTPTSGVITNLTGTCASCTANAAGSVAASGITAATTSATIASGNNPLTWNWAQTTNSQTAITFGETSAATGTTDNLLGVTTAANSTSTPLNITQGATSTVFPTAGLNISQGANTGATAVPAINISQTYNNASLVGVGINFAITNTSSAGSSGANPDCFINFNAGSGGATNVACIDIGGNYRTSGNIQGLAQGTNLNVLGGFGTSSNAGQNGALLAAGSANSNSTSSAKAGALILSGGALSAATPNAAALPGVVQVSSQFLKGSAIAAVGDVVCGTTTAFTVTDCALTPGTNVVGIALTTSNPVMVVNSGQALVSLDGALTAIGDNVCVSTTTAGKGHDNGSTTTGCVLGTAIGVIIADSGTIAVQSGAQALAGVAMSTTLPLVQLHISQ